MYIITYLYFFTDKKSHGSCVAITSTHSSTVSEAIVSLVRTLHALPVWNSVINEAIVERLGLVAQLLSDLSQFQFKVDDCHPGSLACQATGIAASLAIIGGIDVRPRLGGEVALEEGLLGTIARIGQHKVYVQPHEGGPLLRLSLASVVPSPSKRFAVVSITSDALQNISQVNLTPHCGTPTTPVISQTLKVMGGQSKMETNQREKMKKLNERRREEEGKDLSRSSQ
ncbi:E3 ubiquitin-protein ligase HERC2 [Portunus trituberculatus]|uniref:E3 ubiquitin-protein ligase HERC2 n=1 Tax=Portunus trituberculatus TaxID=210409 RepID=A0A5B7FW32_PORTR|nr:E3 ubiquitin-protein ligase HERC2 [Portunus trituberculatus]